MIRDAILTATILAIIFIVYNQPRPVKSVQVDYCLVDEYVGGKEFAVHPDESPALDGKGEPIWRWRFGWTKRYAPCNRQDIFRTI